MIREDVKAQLSWIALWANSFADDGKVVTFDVVHSELQRGTLVQWLSEQGADMSLQLNPEIRELTDAAVRILRTAGESMRGRERRKLAVEKNGYCLLVALFLQALAVDEEY